MSRKAIIGTVSAGCALAAAATFAILALTNRYDAQVKQVQGIQALVANVQALFAQGNLHVDTTGVIGTLPDHAARADIISSAIANLEKNADKHLKNSAMRQAIMSEIAEAQKILGDFIPKYRAALEKEDLSSLEEFSADMARLQQHLDKILQVLQG